MKYQERKEYLKEYRKRFKRVTFEFKPEIKEKLQRLSKEKNMTMIDFVSDLIDKADEK